MNAIRFQSILVAVLASFIIACGGPEQEDTSIPEEQGVGLGKSEQELRAQCGAGTTAFVQCGVWDVTYGCKSKTTKKIVSQKKEFCAPCVDTNGKDFACGVHI